MLIGIREVGTFPGKTAAGHALMKELTSLVREITGLDVESVKPVGGNPQRIAWCTRYQDLAAYEAGWAKIGADPRFAQAMQKTPEIFIPGSMQEVLWQSV
jgi:hypothetical protein